MGARSGPGVVAAALWLAIGCGGDRAAPSAAAAEAELVAPIWADRQPASSAHPSGVYFEGDRLWVWSDAEPVQRSYARAAGGWQAGPVRRGPQGTERCLVGKAALSGSTFCVGRHQNAGLLAFAHGAGAGRAFGALPARAGFRDLVSMDELGLVGVLDAATDQLWWLDRSGNLLARIPLPASSHRVGSAGGDLIFVLSGAQPALLVARVAADGSTRALASWKRSAPLRDAHYDASHDVLWVVGPEDRPVSRRAGPIEHLGSELIALDGPALRRGQVVAQQRVDLQARGLCDPSSVTSASGKVVVSLTGSDRLAWLTRVAGSWQLEAVSTGLAPAGLASSHDLVAVAARLDDRIYLYEAQRAAAARAEVIVVDPRPRDSPRDLGERLFYGALLWSQSRSRPYSCNSCHWDAQSDGRRHPGMREARYEQTRPLGGIGAVSPIFTPGQSRTLSEAVDGFMRILDDRYWRDPGFDEDAIELRLKGGQVRRITPQDKRRALSAFLTSIPVEPGPLLRTGDPALRALVERGAQLFIDDCADCHAPRAERGDGSMRSPKALLEALARRPLVLGATGFAHAGPAPSFTPIGNRISPLLGLSRGGPYFSSGTAASLRDVVEGFARSRPGVHAGTGQPVYDTEQREALTAFLQAL